jgi:phosphate transport system protein
MTAQIPKEKLQQLEGQVQALGSLVEGLLIDAVDVLYDSDLSTLERLGDEERRVHRQRLAIEMGCLSLIATRRPLDGELRPLVAMAEIAAELEHVAEHTRRMARANYSTVDPHLRKPLASLRRLATEVQSLLARAMASFAGRDANAARSVTMGTRDVEILYQPVRNELLGVMKSRPRIANQAMYLSRSAYNLRRTAERVAGICDWVLFVVESSPNGRDPANLPEPLAEDGAIRDL